MFGIAMTLVTATAISVCYYMAHGTFEASDIAFGLAFVACATALQTEHDRRKS